MDSNQGSTPLNFIPFRLENLLKENAPAPTTSQANPVHATSEGSASDPKGHLLEKTCGLTAQSQENIEKDSPSNSQGSSIDVTTYAESVVQRMEQQQVPVLQQVGTPKMDLNNDGSLNTDAKAKTSTDPEIRRSSTPILSEEEDEARDDALSALESAVRVIITSESQLPELRDGTEPELVNVSGAPSRTDEENASSVCDAPALPEGGPQVQFLAGQSEEEKTIEETSQVDPVALYGFNRFNAESETQGGDETNTEIQIPGTSEDPIPKCQLSHSGLPDLSGRSRAILKECFDEASPIRLPVGHSTVASTEPQLYHLLRVLTDEKLNRPFSTMERKVIDAVRGFPTVAPSRTAHFQSKGRCQTPMRRAPDDSSGTESEEEGTSAMAHQPGSSPEDTGESSYYGKSDSATEIDLITKSFKSVSAPHTKGSDSTQTSSGQQQTEPDMSEFSSQDTTLLEIRERAQLTGGTSSKAKKRIGDRRLTRRGVPCEKSFSQNLAGPDSSSQDVQIPSTIPSWSGATSVRKTSPSSR